MVLGPHSYDPHLVCRPGASGGFRWSELVAERDEEQGRSLGSDLEGMEIMPFTSSNVTSTTVTPPVRGGGQS